ncbi:MAG: redoxin domain-containing protein [Planctomycetota bacterium]
MQRLSLLLCLVAIGFGATLVNADEPKKADKKAEKKSAKKLDFELKDLDGKTVKLSDLKDKYVVLEWIEPTCPTCKRHAKEGTVNHLVKKYAKNKDVIVLGVCTSSRSDARAMKAFSDQSKLQYRIVMDPTGKVGRQFGAKKTPHMYIVRNGEKLYEGAFDDDPRGRKAEAERVNYISKALDELLAGKKVSTSYTRPYG